MTKIEPANGWTSNGEDFHLVLEGAQQAALVASFNTLTTATPNTSPTPADMAAHTLKNAEDILAILQLKAKGRPRKNAAAVKPRKARLATAPLPLGRALETAEAAT